MKLRPEDFLDLEQCELAEIFEGVNFVWEVLKKIGSFLKEKLHCFSVEGQIMQGAHVLGPIHLGAGSVIEPGAVIKGPCWIGKDVQVRAGAYIRENVIIGSCSVVGNSCELKNCILLRNCEVPHFNYVGDSVLGFRAHLGAGVILSNIRLDRAEIYINLEGRRIGTGMVKLGAIVGDHCEVGCNSVLNPGSILGRNSRILPLTNWRGYLPEGTVSKNSSIR